MTQVNQNQQVTPVTPATVTVVPAKPANGAETLEQKVARLERENQQLKAAATSVLKLKVSEKGAVSVYGMGKFPVTLYASQMERLIEFAPKITEFIGAHPELSRKGQD